MVDSQGRLVAGATPDYATGQDMTKLEIVRNFVEQGGKAQMVAATREFNVGSGKNAVAMLGTSSPVSSLDWAVIVQKPCDEAYRGVFEMQRTAHILAQMAVALSVGITVFAARRITNPLAALTRFSRAIARGDFSQRVQVKSRTEIGAGNYGLRVREHGPRELALLCRGFNQMAEQLAEVQGRKHRLEHQLAAVQEEERSELARDLHDEIGPLLFAVSVDLASIRQQTELPLNPTIVSRLDAIRDAVNQMQRHVKSILGRLRPPTLLDLGPAQAIDNLIVFWRARYPAVVFDVDMPPNSFGPAIDEQIYRIIQESLNNALRHGRAQHIAIAVRLNTDGIIAVDVSDDGVGFQAADGAGFGLLGMQERMQSLGGTLSARNRHDRSGVIVSARLPYSVDESGDDSNAGRTSAA